MDLLPGQNTPVSHLCRPRAWEGAGGSKTAPLGEAPPGLKAEGLLHPSGLQSICHGLKVYPSCPDLSPGCPTVTRPKWAPPWSPPLPGLLSSRACPLPDLHQARPSHSLVT